MNSREQCLAIVVPAYNEERQIGHTLDSLYNQVLTEDVLHIVVNNASTDSTEMVVNRFAQDHPEFKMIMLEEPEKGTGRAVDTGFRHAIDNGYYVVGRTDSDTLVNPNWSERIVDNFMSNPGLMLIGGKREPRKDDEFYRRRDSVLWPLGINVGIAVSKALSRLDENLGTGTVAGYNMATRAEAYVGTGGFPRTSIENVDEDKEYESRVREQYGSIIIYHFAVSD